MSCFRHQGRPGCRRTWAPPQEGSGRSDGSRSGGPPPPPPGGGQRGNAGYRSPFADPPPNGLGPQPGKADPFADSPNPHRLYKNKQKKVIVGVAAGLADYTGIAVWKIRALLIILAMFFTPQVLIIYGIMAIVLKPRPIAEPLYRDEREETFWRSVSFKPAETFGNLRHKFRELDRRLIAMERTVTSEDYRLRREFTAMETGGPSQAS